MYSKVFINKMEKRQKGVFSSRPFGIKRRAGSSSLHFHLFGLFPLFYRWSQVLVVKRKNTKYIFTLLKLNLSFYPSPDCGQELESSKKEWFEKWKGTWIREEGIYSYLEVTEKHANPVNTQKAPFTVCCLLHGKKMQIVPVVW